MNNYHTKFLGLVLAFFLVSLSLSMGLVSCRRVSSRQTQSEFLAARAFALGCLQGWKLAQEGQPYQTGDEMVTECARRALREHGNDTTKGIWLEVIKYAAAKENVGETNIQSQSTSKLQ